MQSVILRQIQWVSSAMSGKIWVEKPEKRGAKFIIEIPTSIPDK
jgi:hypothetical protein